MTDKERYSSLMFFFLPAYRVKDDATKEDGTIEMGVWEYKRCFQG